MCALDSWKSFRGSFGEMSKDETSQLTSNSLTLHGLIRVLNVALCLAERYLR